MMRAGLSARDLVARMLMCVVMLLVSTTLVAQDQTAVAPLPPALLNGKKVFLSNAGVDSGLFPHPFSGGTDRAYNQAYAALLKEGQYELVSDPGDADLVFELRLSAPYGPANANKVKGASDPLPMFRLTIFDRKTHYVLWALTESIEEANLQKTHDHNFDDALAALMGDLKTVMNPARH
jgi:hypothetical protein